MFDGRKGTEQLIRETWPGATDTPLLAGLAHLLMRTIVLAPLAWLPLALGLGKKVMPFLAKRYTLTNRRIMIRHGLNPSVAKEVALADIDDVVLEDGTYNAFYHTGHLDVIVKGQVAMKLHAVPEPEAFRRAILLTKDSWGTGAAAVYSMAAAPAQAAT